MTLLLFVSFTERQNPFRHLTNLHCVKTTNKLINVKNLNKFISRLPYSTAYSAHTHADSQSAFTGIFTGIHFAHVPLSHSPGLSVSSLFILSYVYCLVFFSIFFLFQDFFAFLCSFIVLGTYSYMRAHCAPLSLACILASNTWQCITNVHRMHISTSYFDSMPAAAIPYFLHSYRPHRPPWPAPTRSSHLAPKLSIFFSPFFFFDIHAIFNSEQTINADSLFLILLSRNIHAAAFIHTTEFP